jgi:muramoyltetrapeptide carboxypeptidase
VILPEPLRPGDRVRIVAPSGPFDRTLVFRGLGWLAERYRVQFDWGIFSRAGFLAGTDERRRSELDRALSEPDVKAVISARGGYGLTRIIGQLDLAALTHSPRWIVGFSDLTALHVECARRGIASLHAANCGGLGRGDAHARAAFLSALEQPNARREFRGLEVWRSGNAEGPLFGGNLTVLFTLAAAGRLFVPDGAIVVLEDVTESSYRLDRMLSALLLSGAFDRVSAIVLGEFTDCPHGPWSVAPHDAVRDCLSGLAVPIVAGLPFGHGRINLPLVLGAPARVLGDSLTLFP